MLDRLRRIIPIARGALLAGAIIVVAGDAHALRYHERPNWMFGVGWGVGRGSLTTSDGETVEYRNGASPHIRLGRSFGQHAMVGVHWQSWLIEFGEVPVKFRRTLQNLSLGFTWFPGNPNGSSGGLFLRVGAGAGLAGTGVKEATVGKAQHGGKRLDEWGVAAFAEGGYEFWVSHNFTAGLGFTYNGFDIGGDFVDTAWFAATILHLNLYF